MASMAPAKTFEPSNPDRNIANIAEINAISDDSDSNCFHILVNKCYFDKIKAVRMP
jgi:hypothetical protein